MRSKLKWIQCRPSLLPLAAIASLLLLQGLILAISDISTSNWGPRTHLRSVPMNIESDAILRANSVKEECRDVHHVSGQCSFVRGHCRDDEAGILPYLTFYFCDLASLKPLAFLILVIWLAVLFASIGISASDFLCINLATIADLLGMSQTLAGVTLLAFGNGSPDVFSTWAAFTTHNGSLAVGELIGAAGFITSVIAGSMALVKPFRVSKKTFVRDAAFFTVAALFSLIFLIDGSLSLWESGVMVAFYLIYVMVVLLWHSLAHRRRKRKDQLLEAREHFDIVHPSIHHNQSRSYVCDPSPAGSGNLDVPYTDNEDEHRGTFLDSGFPGDTNGDEEDHEFSRERFMAEVGQEIRKTHRRTLSRMANSHRPIRPSLLGVLEFGSVLASLERSRSSSSLRLPARRHSHDAQTSLNATLAAGPIIRSASHRETSNRSRLDESNIDRLAPGIGDQPTSRTRSISAGAADLLGRSEHSLNYAKISKNQQPLRLVVPSESSIVIGLQSGGDRSPVPTITLNDSAILPENIQIGAAETPIQPFPPYRDEEDLALREDITLESEHLVRSISRIQSSGWLSKMRVFTASRQDIRQTLFPGLEDWGNQNILSRFISLSTAPTVLILTLTVPVVHLDIAPSPSAKSDCQAPGVHGNNESTAILPVADGVGTLHNPPSTPYLQTPDGLLSPRAVADTHPEPGDTECWDGLPDAALFDSASAETSVEAESTWKPWLVAIQIFTSPLFFVFAFFANDSKNWSQLSRWILCVMLASLCLFLILALIISPEKPPRWQAALAFPGFCVSIAWVSLIAGEVVGVLKTVGVITQISDAILGLTIFAVGNSLSDFLADLAIARLGYPVMALSACFGGPMLNILLGIGLGGLSLTIKKGHKHTQGGVPPLTTDFSIEVGRSLLVSGIGLLITLVGLLVAVPLNGWIMDRRIGIALISFWCITTIVNVVLEAIF